MKRIKVMLIDGSALVRQVLGEVLATDPQIDVISAVASPLLATARMKIQWPDVIVLDIDMPGMEGLPFLRQIMRERPTPIVVCSSRTDAGDRTASEALAAGAVAFIAKPTLGIKQFLGDHASELLSAVRTAAKVRIKPLIVVEKFSADAILPAAAGHGAMIQTTRHIVALGTSTGGTQALEKVLMSLPRVSPGIVIVQHMPEKFTAEFAARLNMLCQIEVREARHKDRVVQGVALIAPGGKHLLLRRVGTQYFVDVIDGPLVNRHRPSVDVLFRSVARSAGANALGVIMTGMGDDGALGLLEMRRAGARTLAQDEESCVVFGMPKEAIKLDAVDKIVPLGAIGREILQQL
ncbi:chemotaxis response regulator protein-glutamate methylesterase [Actimicrobium sp. CCC2.4]|uniref:protein-glutamate methylesterase/protein-glutamine glutaminase n=1 Tax=Actimicrobium sp. CCC2.4 TaxID=3048606 RepID=UPI002AC94D16|nr:chemotaxis response regulator protein-glutamate methylesterase [Actimicrobium sp. CCC2.4]MEB0136344.1 chemotaxis response regulator protein-glutamate methylesterase [Actimicrobium sp. CCC2.4]WPX31165.1 chemotaxis response regulator protein-glutamate methylesterase [Actimicrobium sp. CCC2.4]